LDEVRQAHLPGNYELYDEASNVIGPPICKMCWEEGRVKNSASLHTVWLSVEGWKMVWWLCAGHSQGIGSRAESREVLRSEERLVRSPKIEN
jgi:hypothetical protein